MLSIRNLYLGVSNAPLSLFHGFLLLRQSVSSIASEEDCTSFGKSFLADIFGNCFIRLRQNLSFVIIPLKIASITVVMGLLPKMPVKFVRGQRLMCLPFSIPCSCSFRFLPGFQCQTVHAPLRRSAASRCSALAHVSCGKLNSPAPRLHALDSILQVRDNHCVET